jgi:hypothetical protein
MGDCVVGRAWRATAGDGITGDCGGALDSSEEDVELEEESYDTVETKVLGAVEIRGTGV